MLPGEVPKEEGRAEAGKRKKLSRLASSQHGSSLVKSGTPVLRIGGWGFHTPQPFSLGLGNAWWSFPDIPHTLCCQLSSL